MAFSLPSGLYVPDLDEGVRRVPLHTTDAGLLVVGQVETLKREPVSWARTECTDDGWWDQRHLHVFDDGAEECRCRKWAADDDDI
jgi:hypothetical protein